MNIHSPAMLGFLGLAACCVEWVPGRESDDAEEPEVWAAEWSVLRGCCCLRCWREWAGLESDTPVGAAFMGHPSTTGRET